MRFLRTAASLAALTTCVLAQDKVTLANGDVLTGTIKSMADGKVTITSPLIGDIVVPIADVKDMTTQNAVDLLTTNNELFHRRIAGKEDGRLKLEGDLPPLPVDNLSKINPPKDVPPKWTGQLTLNAAFTDGNTIRRAVGSAFEASRRTEMDRISADAAWDYSEDKDTNRSSATYQEWKMNQRRVGGGLKYDYFLTKRWYALATARVLGDTMADINLRFTGGVGLGYTFIETEKTTFVTEAGVSYFNENYRSDTPSQDYVAARVAYKLTHKFTDKTRLTHGVEAFPSTENADDIYLQMRTELVTSLTDSMIASLGWIMDYDNTPAPGRERADHRVLLSVGWSF